MIDEDLFDLMARKRRDNVPFALCTVVSVERSAPREPGARMIVFADGTFHGTVGGGPLEADVIRAAVDMIARDEPPRKLVLQLDGYREMRCGGSVEIFVDTVLPRPRVIVVGAGHIGHQIARLCELCKMPYAVVDDRPQLAQASRFPGAFRIEVCPIDTAPFERLGVGRWDCIVLVSRTYDYDELCLEAALETPARYIGMMGSARKVGGTLRKLEERGVAVRDDPRVRIPIGLDIGDRSPEHIALSILAEVLQIAYRKDGQPHSMVESTRPGSRPSRLWPGPAKSGSGSSGPVSGATAVQGGRPVNRDPAAHDPLAQGRDCAPPGAPAVSNDAWNPRQYERFRDERTQPFRDLLALVRPRPGMRVVDLGCGTGELTRELHRTLAAAETLGLDSSPAMLDHSAKFAGAGLRFEITRIEEFPRPGEAWDLAFSNAALQWVPDHPELLARLAGAVAPGGQLAVQLPANQDHPSHLVAQEVAEEEEFSRPLGGFVRRHSVLRPEEYATLLHRLGFVEQNVRLQVYGHLLPTPGDVVEWVRGTLLTAYEKRLPPATYARFLDRYRERLLVRLEPGDPYFYAYPRVLFWARKG